MCEPLSLLPIWVVGYATALRARGSEYSNPQTIFQTYPSTSNLLNAHWFSFNDFTVIKFAFFSIQAAWAFCHDMGWLFSSRVKYWLLTFSHSAVVAGMVGGSSLAKWNKWKWNLLLSCFKAFGKFIGILLTEGESKNKHTFFHKNNFVWILSYYFSLVLLCNHRALLVNRFIHT